MRFEFVAFGTKYEGYLKKNNYLNNGNLALDIMSVDEDGIIEPWCNLTTNIANFGDKSLVAVDTNHLQECNIVDVLVSLKVIEDTGLSLPSGFCIYPIYRVTNELDKWCE